MTSRIEAKITVAKLIELAYSEDEGVTGKIVRSRGTFKLRVDQDGNATLSGDAGVVAFKGERALVSLGARLKNVSILFSPGDGSNIHYTAMFSYGRAASVSVSGSFDIEELILSCSGLLCRAARALKGRESGYEMQLKRIMGH